MGRLISRKALLSESTMMVGRHTTTHTALRLVLGFNIITLSRPDELFFVGRSDLKKKTAERFLLYFKVKSPFRILTAEYILGMVLR